VCSEEYFHRRVDGVMEAREPTPAAAWSAGRASDVVGVEAVEVGAHVAVVQEAAQQPVERPKALARRTRAVPTLDRRSELRSTPAHRFRHRARSSLRAARMVLQQLVPSGRRATAIARAIDPARCAHGWPAPTRATPCPAGGPSHAASACQTAPQGRSCGCRMLVRKYAAAWARAW
jgi:hypothetical protein